MITLIVFSKDRAMQLDSLLRSVKDHCMGIDRVDVIAKASSTLHEKAYRELIRTLGPARAYTDFLFDDAAYKPALHEAGSKYENHGLTGHLAFSVQHCDHIALAVDDMIFYRPSDFKRATELLDADGAITWSWRLGFWHSGVERHNLERWSTSALSSDRDYGYLFHSDGALYRTADYTKLLDRFLPNWKTGAYTPNDLEAAVAGRKREWAASVGPHIGPLEPTCITWQLNRVQTKYGSPAAEIPETNLDALAKAYLAGKRVQNEKLYEMLQADAQQFNPPGARPTHVYASEEASKFWAGAIR